MPPMRPVCILRHVQHQRGAVSGLGPLENEYPVFCHHCGIRLKDPDAFFCPACRARLLVGGTEEEEGRTE